jgi:hypothetical protein
MSRVRTLALAALAAALVGCLRAAPEPAAEVTVEKSVVVIDGEPMAGQPVAVAPMPRAVKRRPVAPMPHEPGEIDLTNEDPGLDPRIEAALPEIERLDRLPVEPPGIDVVGAPDPLAPFGVPGLVQPGVENPPAKGKEPKGSFAGRTGATREKLLKQHGGTDDTEKAVAAGLAWLAKQQKADGSWAFDQGAKDETSAATAFAVLAFLGAGETHKDAKGKYRNAVNKGLQSLMKNVPLNGANAGKVAKSATFYGQGITTLALVEAYAQTKDATIKPYAQAALNYIQKNQAKDGSWGYAAAAATGDTSILGWQMQALWVAKQAGLVVDARSVKSAMAFLDKVAAGKNKEHYGYSTNAGAAPSTALTAVGLWTRAHFDGWGPKDAGMEEGVKGLLKRPATKNRLDLYYLHYATMVLKHVGGEAWETWNEGPKAADGSRKGGLRDVLVEAQVADGANAGSWNPDTAFIGNQCGRLGTTALCVINLEVYYRHAAVEKKDADPKK